MTTGCQGVYASSSNSSVHFIMVCTKILTLSALLAVSLSLSESNLSQSKQKRYLHDYPQTHARNKRQADVEEIDVPTSPPNVDGEGPAGSPDIGSGRNRTRGGPGRRRGGGRRGHQPHSHSKGMGCHEKSDKRNRTIPSTTESTESDIRKLYGMSSGYINQDLEHVGYRGQGGRGRGFKYQGGIEPNKNEGGVEQPPKDK